MGILHVSWFVLSISPGPFATPCHWARHELASRKIRSRHTAEMIGLKLNCDPHGINEKSIRRLKSTQQSTELIAVALCELLEPWRAFVA